MRKNLIILLMIIALSFSIIGCSEDAEEIIDNNSDLVEEVEEESSSEVEEVNDKFPMTITDSYDREIVIEEKPETIVSIAPSVTEIIFALDADDMLIGRTDFCDYPNEVSEIESIGSLQEPNIEKITELDPDIIIASTHFSEEALNKLESLGMTVVIYYGSDDMDGTYDTIENIGNLIDRELEAENIVNEMKETVEFVRESVEGLERPSVYYVVSYGEFGDFTATGETFIHQLIDIAGGNNIAEEYTGWAFSLEKIVESDPDIIICSKYYGTKEGIESSNGYKTLTAVKEGRLYEIDNNMLDRQGPRMADGLKELAKIIHPEAF